MTPAELRAAIAAMPWSDLTAAELLEVATIAREVGGTVQAVRVERRREAERQRIDAMRNRPAPATTEPTRDQVYPAGTRFE